MNKNVSSPHRPRLRRLSAEEIELWLSVTQSITRRPGIPVPQRAVPATPPVQPRGAPDNRLKDNNPKEPSPAYPERNAPPPNAPLERRLRQKLARGRAAPEAVIDLHGMRRHEAFIALREFLAAAQLAGTRLVLVVTGKGQRAAPEEGVRPGILRQSVPNWLREPFFHAVVAGFEEAQRPHGGAGAFYVRLRRRDRHARGKATP